MKIDARNRTPYDQHKSPLMKTHSRFGSFLLVVAALCHSVAMGQLDRSRLNEGVKDLGNGPTLGESQDLNTLRLDEENAFAPQSPGDSDLGTQLILKNAQKEDWFRAYADLSGFWTNNAANTPIFEVEDWFWNGRIGFGYQPRITKRLYADFDFQQQIIRYDQFDLLNYESMDLSASLLYVEPRLSNALFFAQFNYLRITGDDFGEELLNSFSVKAGVQKIFLINRLNSVQISILGDWDVSTDLDQLFRNQYIGELTYRFKIMRNLVFAATYRYTYFDYREVDRQDQLQIIGASLTYSPKKWIDLYATANLSLNDSNIEFFEYEADSVGGGFGLKLRF